MIVTKNQTVERFAPPILHETIEITKNTKVLIKLNVSFLARAFLPTEKSEEIITANEKRITQTIVINGKRQEELLKSKLPFIIPIQQVLKPRGRYGFLLCSLTLSQILYPDTAYHPFGYHTFR